MKNNSNRLLTIAVIVLLGIAAGSTLHAQAWRGTAGLRLEVTDRGGRPAVGAEAHLQLMDLEPPEGPPAALADSTGHVTFSGLAEGRWLLEVYVDGTKPYAAILQVVAGKRPVMVAGPIRDAAAPPLEVDLQKYKGPPTRGDDPPPSRRDRREPRRAEPAPPPRPEPTPPTAPPREAPAPPQAEPEPTNQPVSEPITEPAVADPVGREETPTTEVDPAEPMPEPETEPESGPAETTPEPEPAGEPPRTGLPEESPFTVEPDPESLRGVTEPPPAPPPPASEPPPPAPEPESAAPEVAVRSARSGNCPECKRGESAVSATLVAAPAAAGGARRCDAAAAVEQALDRLLASPPATLTGYTGPLVDPGTGNLTAAAGVDARASVGPLLAPYLTPDGPCQLLAVVLPSGARYSGYAYAASDASAGGACVGDEPCDIGLARWNGHPVIRKGDGVTVIYGLFTNESPNRERRAILTVYFGE